MNGMRVIRMSPAAVILAVLAGGCSSLTVERCSTGELCTAVEKAVLSETEIAIDLAVGREVEAQKVVLLGRIYLWCAVRDDGEGRATALLRCSRMDYPVLLAIRDIEQEKRILQQATLRVMQGGGRIVGGTFARLEKLDRIAPVDDGIHSRCTVYNISAEKALMAIRSAEITDLAWGGGYLGSEVLRNGRRVETNTVLLGSGEHQRTYRIVLEPRDGGVVVVVSGHRSVDGGLFFSSRRPLSTAARDRCLKKVVTWLLEKFPGARLAREE